jgi:hypothetical protein
MKPKICSLFWRKISAKPLSLSEWTLRRLCVSKFASLMTWNMIKFHFCLSLKADSEICFEIADSSRQFQWKFRWPLDHFQTQSLLGAQIIPQFSSEVSSYSVKTLWINMHSKQSTTIPKIYHNSKMFSHCNPAILHMHRITKTHNPNRASILSPELL